MGPKAGPTLGPMIREFPTCRKENEFKPAMKTFINNPGTLQEKSSPKMSFAITVLLSRTVICQNDLLKVQFVAAKSLIFCLK